VTDQGKRPPAGARTGAVSGATGEMIFSGDELLRGDTLNTNQCYLGERLLDLGIFATHALTVADDLDAMVQAIRASLARRPVVIVLSGGLGPTEDDLTREAVAEALGRPLEHHEDLLDAIRARFASRGYVMGDSNRKQATIPRGATVIPLTGTAPGFFVWHGPTLVVALPGVPWELKQMWQATVEPVLRDRPEPEAASGSHGASASAGASGSAGASNSDSSQAVRRIRTFGIGESTLAELFKDYDWHDPEATIGTRAHLDGVTLILRGRGSAEGLRKLDAIQQRVLDVLGDKVYGVDGEGLSEIAGHMLRERSLTVAVAESCTGGMLGKCLTDVPGSSAYFMGGVTAYDNQVKMDVLGVPAGMLAQYGAVSEETASAMAEGVRDLLRTDCALSTTGIAGPDGGTPEKPVGLVYIGCTIGGVTTVERSIMYGQRDQVRERAAYAALDLLRRRLLQAVEE
jgi:nicotinamide-nucleotide amidase